MYWLFTVEFLAYYLLSIICIVFLYNCYIKSLSKLLIAVMLYAIIAVPCNMYWYETYYISVFPLLIYHIISLKLMFREIKIKTLISMFAMIYSLNVSISSLIVMLFGISDNLLYIRELINLIIIFIFIAVSLILFKRKAGIKQLLVFIPLYIKRLTVVSVILSAIIVQLISDYNTFESVAKFNVLLRVVLTLLMICIGSAFPLMIVSYIGKAMESEQSENYKRQIQAQAEHYEALSKSNADIRRFKHDYKNMRIAVGGLMKEGRTEEAAALLNEFDEVMNSENRAEINYNTGNGIVDALLLEKQRKAERINTVIEFDGTAPVDKIAPADLCVVLGNILDNAIEAAEKLSKANKKVIKIICKQVNDYIFIKVKNPVQENVKVYNNFIPTTKSDKQSHGFGLYSLNKTVEKYKGSLKLSCEDNTFCTDVELQVV